MLAIPISRRRLFLAVLAWVEPNDDGCWIWQGYVDPCGYGRSSRLQRVERMAHRLSYRIFCVPIPEGMSIDHLCRTRSCVNPEHLEMVPIRENIMRGRTIAATNAAKTHCKRGHEFTPENTYRTAQGNRGCIACRRQRQAIYDRRKRMEHAARRADLKVGAR